MSWSRSHTNLHEIGLGTRLVISVMDEDRDQDERYEDVIFDDEVEEVIPIGAHDQEEELQEELQELEIEEEEEEAAFPLKDDAACCFRRHTGSVFSVSLHPFGELACSGGEDDMAYVWRVSDGSVVCECGGHKDSVTCTGFSHDGKYLATADMGGGVQVWEASTGERTWGGETGDIEWIQWHPQAHVLLVGTSDGGGWMWRVPSGECKTLQGQSCRNVCAAIMPDGKRTCFGYEDGNIKVWDLKQSTVLVTATAPLGHTSVVTCLAAHSDNVLVLSGSEDSTAKLTNTNTGKVVVTFAAGFPSSGENDSPSIEAVGFSPSLPVAVTGSLSGVLGVWDLPTQKPRQQCQHGAGVVRLHCSASSPLVYTGCLDGVVRGWDLRSGGCVQQWHGHSDHILDIAVARDDSVILSASNDHTARVFTNQQTLR